MSVTTALSIPSSIDYTSKDFLGFMSSLQTYVKIAFPEWNIGASEGDIGLAIMEAFAYEGDILSYYGDRISQEAYLPTATQRQSLLNIAQLLGYTVSNGAPATGTVTLQTSAGSPATVVPAGTQITSGFNQTTDSTIIYEVNAGQANYTVPSNATGALTLNVTQGITYSLYNAGTSDGTAAQAFSLPQTLVIDGSVIVYTQAAGGNDIQWTYVQFLGDFGPSDQVFTTYLDASGLTWIQFGDSVNGSIPTNAVSILVTYRVGAGSAGNVAAGQVGPFVNPISGVGVQVLAGGAYNSSAMSGGTDPESNDQIRSNAPAFFATTQRAVSLNDFIAMAQNIPGVTAVNAVSLHSTSVSLYLMGNNNQPANSVTQTAVTSFFTGKTLAGVTVNVAQPTLVAIDVGSVGTPITLVVNQGFTQSAVVTNVTSSLNTLFSTPNTVFGQTITVGQVYATILAVPGVAYAVIPVITREDVTQANTTPITLRGFEIAVPGNYFITASGGA